MNSNYKNKQKAHALGQRGEVWAQALLMLKGYKILKRRYKTPVGEVDLVARRGKTLVFVEVKVRQNIDDAAYSITPRQMKRIEMAANMFLASYPAFSEYFCRFDAVLLAPRRLPTHITNAWQASA